MGRKKDEYQEIICQLLAVDRSTYFRYKKENRLIIRFLQSFSAFSLKAWENKQEINNKFFELEKGYVQIRSFTNELNRQDLCLFQTALIKTESYEKFLKYVKNNSIYFYKLLVQRDQLCMFSKNIFLHKQKLLKYIGGFSSEYCGKDTINFNLNSFIFKTFTRLNFDKFESKKEVISFVYDLVTLASYLANSSEGQKYEEAYLFDQNNLLEKIETIFEKSFGK